MKPQGLVSDRQAITHDKPAAKAWGRTPSFTQRSEPPQVVLARLGELAIDRTWRPACVVLCGFFLLTMKSGHHQANLFIGNVGRQSLF
jgi:hypothetical protein